MKSRSDPIPIVQERLARCLTRADVLRVGAAWGRALAAGQFDEETRRLVRAMIEAKYETIVADKVTP